jgi:hypothetical protein
MLAEPDDIRLVGQSLQKLADDEFAREELDRALEAGDLDSAAGAAERIMGGGADPGGWHCTTFLVSGVTAGPKVSDQWEVKEVCWGPGGERFDDETHARLGDELPHARNGEHLIQILKDLGIIRCGLTLVRKDGEQTLFEYAKTVCTAG